MRDPVILACLLILGVVAYIERDRLFPPAKPEVVYVKPVPKQREHHYAPEGTFYMVDYASARTAKGIVGFEKGREVRLVSVDKNKGTLMVTDGQYNIEVKPGQLTNDMDLAELARMQDEASQSQLVTAIERQRSEADQAQRQIDIDHAKNIARLGGGAPIGGGTSKLDSKPTQVGTWEPYGYRYYNSYYGSPYYYLNR